MAATLHQAPPRRLLTESEAASYIGVSRSFLRKARCFGVLDGHSPAPPFIKTSGGRMVRYALDDLDTWIDGNRRQCPGVGA